MTPGSSAPPAPRRTVKRPRTIRAQAVGWLLVPLGLLSVADAVASYASIRRALNAAWDRSLYAAALGISEGVEFPASGAPPALVQPPVSLEVLDTAAQERVFYRVAYRRGDDPEVFMTGYGDLPAPGPLQPGKPRFYQRRYRGEPVRISALATLLATDPPTTLTVQVAETVGGRAALARDLLKRDLATRLVLVLLAGAIGWFAITRGLRPLRSVSEEVAGRSPEDLSAVKGENVPQEIAPLVGAVNDLMGRVKTAIVVQRRFIANAAHALKTPLAVLRTQSEIALRQDAPDAMRREIAKLRDTSQAVGHLADQLLALARAERARSDEPPAELDLCAVAREACAALAPVVVARDVNLEYYGDCPLPIRGWDHEIREAIGNLIDNALRYGRPKGTIVVRVERREEAVALLVQDDGPGIPEADRRRVLRPFQRRPGSAGEGSGLGLAIVDEIAQGHGAGLRLLDVPGGPGLRVELLFPPA